MANTRKATEPTFPNVEAVLAAIDQAQLPKRTVMLCLRGDLVAEVDELEAKLRVIPAPDRLTGNVEGRRIAERIEELRQQMQESTVPFRMQGMERRAFQEFAAAHADDSNDDTDFALVKASVVEPKLTDEQWDKLAAKLTASQYRELSEAAAGLNFEKPAVPFSQAASLFLRNSDEK